MGGGCGGVVLKLACAGLNGPTGPNGLACEWKCAEITSDDGVGLCVFNLPGIADAENTGTESNFTETTLKWAAECDVVAWVTNVRTCFLTSASRATRQSSSSSASCS